MTTSGVNSWNPVVTDIVTQALAQMGVIDEDEIPTGGMMTKGIWQLNAIVTAAQATGAHVWTEEEAILFLQPNQVRYEIGGPETNGDTSDANAWTQLTLSANAAQGAGSITVASAAGITSGQNIGVILDDGTTQWTTVNGAPSGNVITLAAVLTGSASSGNYAMAYTSAISRPLKVPAARLLYLNGLNEVPMKVMSRQEYMDTPNKLSPGTPTQFFYTPQVDRGILYCWPAPQFSTYAIRFTWYRPLEDFINANDTMDFPQEWVSPLVWTLARDLMGVYDTPPPRQQFINAQAALYADLLTGYDRESEPVQFGMSWEVVNND